MLYQIREYIKFLLRSTNQHGVHSPFVFKLVTQCFYDKKSYSEYITLNNYRKKLLNSKEIIEVTDFGSGSRVFKSNARNVSNIAKHAGISKKRAQLLFRVVNYLHPKNILELGTSLGLATSTMAFANPKANIATIEGCKHTARIAEQTFNNFQLRNIDLRVNNFDDELKQPNKNNFDLIYIDGNHNKESTLNYFKTLLNNIHNNSVIIFDDIYWSKGMTEAWKQIKQHPKVTVSIDTFQWGMVFFRKEQVKEHFTIRI